MAAMQNLRVGKLEIKASEGAEFYFQKYSTINGTIINE